MSQVLYLRILYSVIYNMRYKAKFNEISLSMNDNYISLNDIFYLNL